MGPGKIAHGFTRIQFILERPGRLMCVLRQQRLVRTSRPARILFIAKAQRRTAANTNSMFIAPKEERMLRCCFSFMAVPGKAGIARCTARWATDMGGRALSLWCPA